MKLPSNLKSEYKTLKEIAFDMSVLVVEDDISLQEQLKRFLSSFFGSVTAVDNGREALIEYKKDKYDLVITDINMPYICGVELSQKIKYIDETQYIIIISAHTESEKSIQLINIGIDGFIIKPIEIEIVIRQLTKSCQAIYDRKILEYLNNVLEEANQELKDDNIELKQAISELMHVRESENELDSISRELSEDDKTMLYTRRKKMSAAEFYDVYPFELEKTNENLEELEDKFNLLLVNDKQNINHETLLTLTKILRDFGKEIELIPHFSQLAYGIQELGITFESIEDHSKLPDVMPMVTSLFDNLENWRKGIFYYRNVDDIHYMDNSLISDSLSLQGFLSNTHSSSDSEMELF
jgi:DNA-binding response OmpR family regulator